MPFVLSAPVGINQALLGVYVLIGGLGVALALSARERTLCIAAAIHALSGVLSVLAHDLLTLLVAWELLTFSAFVIIRRGPGRGRPLLRRDGPDLGTPPGAGNQHSARAAYWYLAAQICAAVLFFVAIVIHAGESGSLAVAPLEAPAQPFMVAAVLIKTAMMPLHGWLIGSYTRAGFLGSFVLSAYATKVGVYTAAESVVFVHGNVPIISTIGAVVAVCAVFFALAQHSARRLLSFHIISQVGYMLAGVGLAGTGEAAAGISAGLFHSVNHILYKALLFLVVAVVADRVGHDDLRRMGRLARSMPLVFVCAVIGALSIVGLPATSGYVSKELLKKVGGELQTTLLIVASVGTGLSFTKFIYLIFLRPTRGEEPDAGRMRAAGGAERFGLAPAASVALVTLAALSIGIGLVPSAVPGVPVHDFYSLEAIFSGLYPAGLALVLWFLVRRWLLSRSEGEEREPFLRRTLLVSARPVRAALRRAYRLDAQTALTIATAAAVALTFVLMLL